MSGSQGICLCIFVENTCTNIIYLFIIEWEAYTRLNSLKSIQVELYKLNWLNHKFTLLCTIPWYKLDCFLSIIMCTPFSFFVFKCGAFTKLIWASNPSKSSNKLDCLNQKLTFCLFGQVKCIYLFIFVHWICVLDTWPLFHLFPACFKLILS